MGWIVQLSPIITLFPINTFGWIMVFFPIVALSETDLVASLKGLKEVASLLKSLKGSSEISNAFPSGQSTCLLIKTMVAADSNALS